MLEWCQEKFSMFVFHTILILLSFIFTLLLPDFLSFSHFPILFLPLFSYHLLSFLPLSGADLGAGHFSAFRHLLFAWRYKEFKGRPYKINGAKRKGVVGEMRMRKQ
jgi:hypothetical protein